MRSSFDVENNLLIQSRNRYDLNDNSYSRKENFYQNNSTFPYYAMLQKLVGPKAASFYFKCDSLEADIQSNYQNLLTRCLQLEDRYRKIQEVFSFENTNLEKEEEALLNQTEADILNIQKLIKSMQQNEEYIKREYAYITNLEFENQNRSKSLELYAAQIEQERFDLFEHSYSKLSHAYSSFNSTSTYRSSNCYEFSKPIKISFKKEKLQNLYQILKKKEQLYLSQIQNMKEKEAKIARQQENSEKMYSQKMQQIQKLKSALLDQFSLEKEMNFRQSYSEELNKMLENLKRRKNELTMKTFDIEKEKQILNEVRQKLRQNEIQLQTRKQEIDEKQRQIQIKKDWKRSLLEEVEKAENEMHQKERLIIRINQQIIENAMKFDDVLYDSQKELDDLNFLANRTSSRDKITPSEELYEILHSNTME